MGQGHDLCKVSTGQTVSELTLYQMTKFNATPKVIADYNFNAAQMIEFMLEWVENGKHGRKRRKCWLPAFSPFPTMF